MIYMFEDYTLDTNRRELRRASELVSVEPQVFDLLHYLVSTSDRLVTKNELITAVWGRRVVSESTFTSRLTAVRHAVGDSGKGQRLIRTVPHKGVRFTGEVRQVDPKLVALTLPTKPSIAVLPFRNLSGDPTQEYFADGIVEDIVTALSRMRWLFVIARNSSFTYKGRNVDVREIGRQLGVRYVLQGSVRKAMNRVRISAQLIDASVAVHLWSGRFEGALGEVFDLQDQVTSNVIGAIAPELQHAEIERAKQKTTGNLDAYDYFLRGMALEGLAEGLEQRTSEGTSKALKQFYAAIRFDTDFAAAYGMAALCYAQRKAFGWMTNREREISEAARLARRAIDGNYDAVALGTGGYVLAYVVHELDAGAASIELALALNPNFASAWVFSGWTKIWLGQPNAAIDDLARAMRLSPLGRGIAGMEAAVAHAHFFAGRYDEAAACARRVLREHPSSHPGLRIAAACNAAAGHLKEAKNATARLRQLDPALRVTNVRDSLGPYQTPALTKYEWALRKAGLPEV
jgi:TolB-like protein/Tfp pilus assembly protein PilF